MKVMYKWVFAATRPLALAVALCGATVLASCGDDDGDNTNNQTQEQLTGDRAVFTEHTRGAMKTMAENLNFTSWETANTYNQFFNQYVLNNPAFERAILLKFAQIALSTIQDVEAESTLAQYGFQKVGTVDLTSFNFCFTMNENNTGFDVEEADEFEVILNGWNTNTNQMENGLYKVALQSVGTPFERVLPFPNVDGLAVIIRMAPEFNFALSNKLTGEWHEDFKGVMHFEEPDGAFDASQGLKADMTVESDILAGANGKADKTKLELSINLDRPNDKADVQLSWSQNGLKVLDFTLKESGINQNGIRSLSEILQNSSSTASIFDVLAALIGGHKLEEGKLTLLDDLTTTISISDNGKCFKVAREATDARRNNADEQATEEYTKQLNELMTCTMTCKGINQTIPMQMMTTKLGTDYVSLPAFKFADETTYVPISQMLDMQSLAYALNIIDHAAAPAQQGIIIGRQLLQYVQNIIGVVQNSGQMLTQPAQE